MPQSERPGNSLLPVVVIGGLVLGSMFVMLMLFVFSGLIDFPLSIVALTVMGALPYWRARCLPPRGPGEVA